MSEYDPEPVNDDLRPSPFPNQEEQIRSIPADRYKYLQDLLTEEFLWHLDLVQSALNDLNMAIELGPVTRVQRHLYGVVLHAAIACRIARHPLLQHLGLLQSGDRVVADALRHAEILLTPDMVLGQTAMQGWHLGSRNQIVLDTGTITKEWEKGMVPLCSFERGTSFWYVGNVALSIGHIVGWVHRARHRLMRPL
jgi:hypothetical protein